MFQLSRALTLGNLPCWRGIHQEVVVHDCTFKKLQTQSQKDSIAQTWNHWMQLCFTWTETHNSLRPAAGENVAPIQNMHTTTGWSSVDLMPTPVAVAVWFQQPVLVGALPFSLTSLRNVQHDTVVNCCFEVSNQFAKSCHRNQSWLWHVTAQFLYSVHQIRSVTWQVKQCPQNWTKTWAWIVPSHGIDCCLAFPKCYHYIRARGLGGDGPEDIISSVSAEFVVALRNNRVSKTKTETFVGRMITAMTNRCAAEHVEMSCNNRCVRSCGILPSSLLFHISRGRISVPSFRRLGIG